MRPEIPKTAVVTGAGSGLGRALCVELGRRGWQVGAVDLNESAAQETVELVRAAGGIGEACACDVRDLPSMEKLADHFFESFGRVGMVFNNAGVGSGGEVGVLPMEEWRKTIDTNLWGVIYGCHVFAPRLKEQGCGHIINTGSIGAFVALPGTAAYCASKAAVVGISETMYSECRPYGVGVSVICPSFFKSNIMENVLFGEYYQKELLEQAFENARMDCDDIARHVLKAVEKNRLYVLPQASAWFSWLNKRIAGTTLIKTWAWLNKRGWIEAVLRLSVKAGL